MLLPQGTRLKVSQCVICEYDELPANPLKKQIMNYKDMAVAGRLGTLPDSSAIAICATMLLVAFDRDSPTPFTGLVSD